jgi:hypothetical protein
VIIKPPIQCSSIDAQHGGNTGYPTLACRQQNLNDVSRSIDDRLLSDARGVEKQL